MRKIIFMSLVVSAMIQGCGGGANKNAATSNGSSENSEVAIEKINIRNPKDDVEDLAKYEENRDYQVLYSKNVGGTTNFYILLLWEKFDEDRLEKLAKAIKKEKSPKKACNIYVYDSKDIVPLIDKYPLKGKEYVNVADHFVYMLSFDGMTMYYPFIGWQYKEYGGKKTFETPKIDVEDLAKYEENRDYEVLYSKNVGGTTNFYILLLWKKFEEDRLEKLAKAIKKEKSPKKACNIYVYDSKDIVPLIDKYPLKGKEYVNVADHFVYMLSFDGMTMYYPFIDWQYKEYGGKKTIR